MSDRAPKTLSLILPAYNEARRLPASLARCAEFFRARALEAEIIVVDDGSTDGTPAAFADAVATLPQAHLAYHLLPMPHAGKGAAVRAGVAAAIGDPIVFLDADLTIPVESIDRFLAALADGADIAVASRYIEGAVVERPWWRVFMSNVFHACVHLIVPVDVKDTQCGGKAYTAEAAKYLFRTSRLDGFAFDAEVIFLARREGYRVAELPVELHQFGKTSIDFLADTLRMLRDLVLIRFNATARRYQRVRSARPARRPSLDPGE